MAFCGCHEAHLSGLPRQQLLQNGWFPSTHAKPQTAFTIQLLNLYHLSTLHGKITMYDFYGSIEKLTDNTGTEKVKVFKYSNRLASMLTLYRTGSRLLRELYENIDFLNY